MLGELFGAKEPGKKAAIIDLFLKINEVGPGKRSWRKDHGSANERILVKRTGLS
jgi:hypothetical protein